MEKLAQHIEALVFATDTPVTKNDILECLEKTFDTAFDPELVDEAIGQVRERYAQPDFAIELVQISGGFQFMTKGAYHGVIASWLKLTTKKRLSKAAIETLSIIAYKQPVTKSECEAIRGVSCDYSLQKLLEKELVSITGRSDRPGRPLLYGTSPKFMDYFGLKDMADLPQPKDFKTPDSEVGEASVEELAGARPMAAMPTEAGIDLAEEVAMAVEMASAADMEMTAEEPDRKDGNETGEVPESQGAILPKAEKEDDDTSEEE